MDLTRYWYLESRWARGENVSELLRAAQEELDWTSEEHRALTRSLIAVLLAADGRLQEAFSEGRQARTQLMIDKRTYPTARAYFDVVTERFARIARQAGHDKEAEDAEGEYRQWHQEQKARLSYWPPGLKPLVRDSP